MSIAREFFGCLDCTYIIKTSHTGKCPSCDGQLGYFRLEELSPAEQNLPDSVAEPEQVTGGGADEMIPRSEKGWYYWEANYQSGGKACTSYWLAVSADHARHRVYRHSRTPESESIQALDGQELRLPREGEPNRSIAVKRLHFRPVEYYDEDYHLVRELSD